jgi:DNA mismatch repair protein MutL
VALSGTSRVRRLSDDLVNKIAAGEVVERPASVVKELVENAVDAGARTVRVEIEGGGRKLVRVRDDGAGMGREDAALALERHATSKLRELDDLQSLVSHGFRGEALPSIASVSHLLLRTRETSDPSGTEVEVRHGGPVEVRAAGHPVGTTVEVRDLFGTVPARRKFLRSDGTEAGHVSEAVTLLALAHPTVGFWLVSGGREVIGAPAVSGLDERVFQLFGGRLLADMLPVDGGFAPLSVRGFVQKPELAGGSRANLRLFVNGRAVRDRGLSRALAEGCRAAGLGDFRGDAVLLVELPPHMVDVNVHPTKSEVRFADARAVWSAVEQAVRQSLSGTARPEVPPAVRDTVVEAAERFASRPPAAQQPFWPSIVQDRPTDAGIEAAEPLPAGTEREPVRVLGQHRNCYLVATDGEELVLLDQHTAHERVLFERILAQEAAKTPLAQGLLVPAIVRLPPKLRPMLEEAKATLSGLGFDVEPFGGEDVRIVTVPAALAGRDPGPALLALLADVIEREAADWAVAGTRHRVAATIACHAAVRAGQPLTAPVMQAIAAGLAVTEQPTLCPHGRPTRVRIPQDEVARWFRRTGWTRQ